MFANSTACLLLTLLLGANDFVRTWTDTTGRTLEGSFVRVDGDQVVIKMEEREVSVPLDRLSLTDRNFARAQAATQAAIAKEEAEAAAAEAEKKSPSPAPAAESFPSAPQVDTENGPLKPIG